MDDEIMDFFNFSKPFKRVVVSSGTFAGRRQIKENYSTDIVKRETDGGDGTEYVQKYADAEKKEMMQEITDDNDIKSRAGPSSRNSSFIDELDDIDMADEKRKIHNNDEIYQKYDCKPSGEYGVDLPIAPYRNEILKLIDENRVVIIEGSTGCGKTTQVPQYILENAAERNEFCNIVCTQPRRIAAISIAKRVCEEKSFPIGSVVGFQVGLHENASPDTRLLYCTTGVLLQKLIRTKEMSRYTHIILDEVHERDQDMDFLLIVVRKLLIGISPNTKIILMSATINSKIFSDYFHFIRRGKISNAPIIECSQRRMFDIQHFYIDELARLRANLDINYDEPGISDDTYKIALKLIIVMDKMDAASTDILPFDYKPSILIFLPGINEIEKMEKTLETVNDLANFIKFIPVKLHSLISPKDQQKAFIRPPSNYRKIIFATNIAESSITVPDVKYVIDFCLTKSLVTNTSTNLTSLELHWSSKASCNQRSGRAGRVMNGRVYRLVSKYYYDNYMEEYDVPEMTRCPLENVCLRAKLLDMGPPQAILALALSPPDLRNIKNTILLLKELGALLLTVNGQYDPFDGDLTFIGRVMAALPIDIQLSRLIIFGYIFSVMEDTIIIAAGLSVKSVFNFYKNELTAYCQKLTWADGSGSDLIAILKAYQVWVSKYEQKHFPNEDSEASWASRYNINTKSIREMHILIKELQQRLQHIGIKEFIGTERVNWLDHERSIILKICIAGAFYPNYLLRTSSNNTTGEREAFHTLCGYDPCNTVFFSGFDNAKYIGELYVDQIKKLFAKACIPAKNIKIRFHEGTQKIFVIFTNDEEDMRNTHNLVLTVPGRVSADVYKALKMRFCRSNNTIKVMRRDEQIEFAEANEYGHLQNGKWIRKLPQLPDSQLVVLPSVLNKNVKGKITHIDHCGKFWFRPISEESKMKEINVFLNNPDNLCIVLPSDLKRGTLVAALFEQRYHRARVINMEEKIKKSFFFKVIFIDYGNIEIVDCNDLRNFNHKAYTEWSPRVFQCGLAGVQPSTINCRTGHWQKAAMELMQQKSDECERLQGFVVLEIYSVLNAIASVIMKTSDEEKSFNDFLIEDGLAQFCEENYMSKMDHDLRLRRQRAKSYENESSFAIPEEYVKALVDDANGDKELPQPEIQNCPININLRGPSSPLEAKVHAAVRVGLYKTVNIERESVNSILLDSDPQENHERMLVAAAMTEGNDKGLLTARSTTTMPNIPGFAPLMCLIFCPTMEIRRNLSKTVYTSILAGLGFDSNKNQSIFEEHDMIFNLDVEITHRDFQLINQIRYSMDSLLHCYPGEELPSMSYQNRVVLTAKIKHLIIQLLETPRRYIETKYDMREHIWGQIDESDNDILLPKDIYVDRAIFPLHKVLRLYQSPFERDCTLREECRKLYHTSRIHVRIDENLKCKLCDENIDNIVELRIHLLSKLHKDREYQIGFVMKN